LPRILDIQLSSIHLTQYSSRIATMYSFKASAALAASMLLTLSSAQYTIDPTSVPTSQRDTWCQSQQTACPLLCLQLPGESSTTDANTCDADTLTYQCVCGNGQSPNASEYSQTLPYFICTEYGTQCVNACANGDTSCQSACRDDHPVGSGLDSIWKPYKMCLGYNEVNGLAASAVLTYQAS